ncbi:MAG: M14 family metallopeptidase [Candidatus Poseidoniaceae archaeon]|nr:M14 family metallopeptidase [Candidatus Poseidoniaceae archaeon]
MLARLWFSKSYAEAAGRFTIACQELTSAGHNVSHHRLKLGMKGPVAEDLAIDIAVIGSLESGKAIMSSSGVHGVEGYPGSAIQLSIMDKLAKAPPFDDHAVIVIHAVNPYGMAWWRRFNENNVDLNRNFLRLDEQYSGVPEGYEKVMDFINPKTVPKKNEYSYNIRALMLILKHGFSNLKQAVAEGQYQYPTAIQYGGSKLEKGPTMLIDWLSTNLASIQKLFAIDHHTGLGPSGHDTLLLPLKLRDNDIDKFEELQKLFPGHIELLDAKSGVGYEIKGDIHQGLVNRFPNISWTYLTQEFGTFKPTKVIRASRDENRWTQWGDHIDEADAKNHWTRYNLLRIFNPDDDIWREKIISRGNIVFDSAIQHLLSDN